MPFTTAVCLQAFNLTAELTLNVGFPPYDNLGSIILFLEKVKPFETGFSTNQKAGIFVAPKVLQLHRAIKVGVNNLKVFSRGRAGHTAYLTTLAGLNTIVAIQLVFLRLPDGNPVNKLWDSRKIFLVNVSQPTVPSSE